MRKIKFMLSCSLLIIMNCANQNIVFAQENPVKENKVIRILSFNILHGATIKKDFNLNVIAKVIEDTQPDLVALQEVDFKTNRAHKLDLATELGLKTKMLPLFGRAFKYDQGEYGVAILSKHSFISSRNIPLPYTREPRTALEVVTVLPSNDTIAFVVTHLDNLKDNTDRIAQVKIINQSFVSNKYPTILAGDLNATPGSITINMLEKIWGSSYDKKNIEPTFPSNSPKRKLDYIMYFPKNNWKVLSTKVIRNSIASDHCAFLSVIEILNN